MLVLFLFFFLTLGYLSLFAVMGFWLMESYCEFRKRYAHAALASRRIGKAVIVAGACLTCATAQAYAMSVLMPDIVKPVSTTVLLAGLGAAPAAYLVSLVCRWKERQHLEKAGSMKTPNVT